MKSWPRPVHIPLVALLAILLTGAAPCGGEDDDTKQQTDGSVAADSGAQADRSTGSDSAAKADASTGKCAGNPLAKSCFLAFMTGCWAPDMTGKCTDTGLTLTWSDGHKLVRSGAKPGFYRPGDTNPCFSFKYNLSTKTTTYTKGGKTITDVQTGNTHTVTCTDGKKETYTNAQGLAWNKCVGLLCP